MGTTLGADNGIALALILDLFTDPLAKHGPLEAIFTVTEETGLIGAFGLDPTLIRSCMLLNLDSEEEGVFYIGCAGGNEVEATLGVEWDTVPAYRNGAGGGWPAWRSFRSRCGQAACQFDCVHHAFPARLE